MPLLPPLPEVEFENDDTRRYIPRWSLHYWHRSTLTTKILMVSSLSVLLLGILLISLALIFTQRHPQDVSSEINDLKMTLLKIQSSGKEFRKKLEDWEFKLIPLNFIYVQFGGQAEPKVLWPSPTIKWEDVTSKYSGLFFRALGGQSADFGVVQEDQIPRISKVDADGTYTNLTIEIPRREGVSGRLYSGGWSQTEKETHYGLQFTVTGTEVRPRNSAIKIWKRI